MSVICKRSAGIVLHPSSISRGWGIGSLGSGIYEFIDWLSDAGVSVWQVLPLVPNGRENSPYLSWSAFAGNPLLIDLDLLVEAELLDQKDVRLERADSRSVDYDLIRKHKLPLVFKAARRLIDSPSHSLSKGCREFSTANSWVRVAALFCVLRYDVFEKPWLEWPHDLKFAERAAIEAATREYSEKIDEVSAALFLFEYQWEKIRAYCENKGISILGDVPIYVDHDSCDVWLNRNLFRLDSSGRPLVVAGVPPDYFSKKGQFWKNPIYDWDEMADEAYAWWKARLGRALELADVVRIDHFRALSAYWEIPAGTTDARKGRWVAGPGQAFFDELKRSFPSLPFVAEDLGTLDGDVHRLRDDNGLMGMRVMQFGFDGDDANINLPDNYAPDCICYTGTHDNQTLVGWRRALPPKVWKCVAGYFGVEFDCDDEEFVWNAVERVCSSDAGIVVFPLQDILLLDDSARMNVPGSEVGNWKWRLGGGELTSGLAGRFARVLSETKRKRLQKCRS